MPAEDVTRPKDHHPLKQAGRPSDNLILDLHELRFVEMHAKRADDSDKPGLTPASDGENLVELTALARGKVWVDEKNQAIHFPVFTHNLSVQAQEPVDPN